MQNDTNPTNNEARFSVAVGAEREVRTRVSAEELRAVVGTTYELTYTLDALGRLPAENVRFLIQLPSAGVIESVVDRFDHLCRGSGFHHLRFRHAESGRRAHRRRAIPHDAKLHVAHDLATRCGTLRSAPNIRDAHTWVYANLTIDVAANMGGFFGTDEGVTGEAGFSVETKGVNPAQNVTATIELAPPLRLLSLRYSDGPSGWTCELLTAQRGRCTGSFPGGDQVNQRFATVWYTFVSDTAVNGQATLTVDAASDGDPTNNVAQVTLQVRPYIDIAVSAA